MMLRALAAACAVAAASECSPGAAPLPPAGSEWSAGSDSRCTHGGGVPAGHTCVAVCQLGFHAVGGGSINETFTCPAGAERLRPTSGSTFGCAEDPQEQCSAAPPCEDDGCEWAACTDPRPGALHNLCTAECRAGFYTPRADSVRYECVPAAPLGMAWVTANNAEPLVCAPLCSTFPPMDGQHWRTGGASDRRLCGSPPYTNQSCQVGCDGGFDWAQGTDALCKADTGWDAGSRVGWYSCEAGAWQRDEVVECVCTPKVCAATPSDLPVPHATSCPHSHYQSPDGRNQTAGVCHVRCDAGYQTVAGSGVYGCSSDGVWEPHSNPLACERTCTARLPVLHADPHGCKGLGGRELPVAGERCDGECAANYIETDLATYTCSDEGQWQSEGGFSCVADYDAQVCHSDAPAKNLHFVPGCNHTLPGAQCEAACDEGHTGDGGDPMFMCDAAGRWVPKSFNRLDCSLNRCPTGQAPQVASSGSTHCTICVPGDSRKLCQFTAWDWICGVCTIATVLSVPLIIWKFKKDLNAELTGPPLTLPRGEDALGWVGVLMFATGVLDLGLDISLCLALASCNQPYLLASCLTTLLVTMAVTIHLGFYTLDKIRDGNVDAGDWWIKNGSLASVTVIASSSRIESLAILKLRLCGFWISKMPVEDAIFHFLRYEGSYHYFLEDGPHLLVAIALLTSTDPSSSICGESHDWLPDALRPSDEHARLIAVLSVVHTVVSMIYGCISKQGQKRMAGDTARRTTRVTASLVVRIRDSLRASLSPLPEADSPLPEPEELLLGGVGGGGSE